MYLDILDMTSSQMSNLNLLLMQDDYSRTLRRTIMRYLNLSTILVFRTVSQKVKARFPKYESLVDAGVMLPGEDLRLSKVDAL